MIVTPAIIVATSTPPLGAKLGSAEYPQSALASTNPPSTSIANARTPVKTPLIRRMVAWP